LKTVKPLAVVRNKAGDSILALVLKIPPTREAALPDDAQARLRANVVARAAARKASLLAGSMALPPGPLGWITFLPELVTVWKVQGQMVADIAGIYGQHATLTREHLLYCLFKHLSAQALRDVVVRVGERLLVQKTSGALLQSLAQKIGVQVSQKVLGKSVSRFVPLIGAVGVGAYAYFDTTRVAQTATELFSGSAGADEFGAQERRAESGAPHNASSAARKASR
jgi:hypothetical protein